MLIAPPRPHEARVLAALRELDVLDSAPDEEFDALTRVASLVCGTPIALLTLVDQDRQWFKAVTGIEGITQTSRDIAFCAHSVLRDDVTEIPDAGAFVIIADPTGAMIGLWQNKRS